MREEDLNCGDITSFDIIQGMSLMPGGEAPDDDDEEAEA